MRTPTLAPWCSPPNLSACLTLQGKKKTTEGSQVSLMWREMRVQSCWATAAAPVWQKSSAPNLDAFCSQGDKRVVFGRSPRIFRLFSGTGVVAAKRVMKPMETAWFDMPQGSTAPTGLAVFPVCSGAQLSPHIWLSLRKLRLTPCLMRLDLTLGQMARISWNFSFFVNATLNIYEV